MDQAFYDLRCLQCYRNCLEASEVSFRTLPSADTPVRALDKILEEDLFLTFGYHRISLFQICSYLQINLDHILIFGDHS